MAEEPALEVVPEHYGSDAFPCHGCRFQVVRRHATPDQVWSNGTVLDVDTTRRILAREEDSTARTVRRGLLYAVQSDTYIYLTEEVAMANGPRA